MNRNWKIKKVLEIRHFRLDWETILKKERVFKRKRV